MPRGVPRRAPCHLLRGGGGLTARAGEPLLERGTSGGACTEGGIFMARSVISANSANGSAGDASTSDHLRKGVAALRAGPASPSSNTTMWAPRFDRRSASSEASSNDWKRTISCELNESGSCYGSGWTTVARRSEELVWHKGESVIVRAHTREHATRRYRARQAYNTLHTTDVSRAHDRKCVARPSTHTLTLHVGALLPALKH